MVFISIYIGSVIVVITSIVIYLRWRFTYWSRLGVPGPNFIEWEALTSIHHEFTLKQIKKYGRIYGSYDLINKSIIINEPDLIRDIMVKDFHLFPHRNHFYKGSSKINSSLFFLRGNQDWKRIRSILSPSFTSGKLRSMMANISDVSDKFVLKLEQICDKGDSVDIRKYIGAFSMDVISACAYGIQIDSIDNPNHPIVLNAKKILNVDASLAMFLSIFAPPLAEYLKLEPFDVKAVNYFDELTAKIVKVRKHLTEMKYKNKMMKRTDFLQLMINTERNIKDIDQTNDEES